MTTPLYNPPKSTLLTLPTEIRLQIYSHVIGTPIIYIRLKWSGICIPSGFTYSRLNHLSSLLEPVESAISRHFIPLGTDFRFLNETCRQIKVETDDLPFKNWIWAFESVFTLDQWVGMERGVGGKRKACVRRVAVPMPGPYRSSERVLEGLSEVLLVGVSGGLGKEEGGGDGSRKGIISLRKDWLNDTWVSSGEGRIYERGK